MDGNVDPIVQDLLANESFRAWVSGASDQDAAYWREWPRRNPDRQSAFELAVMLAEGLPFRFAEQPVDPQLIQQDWEKLRRRSQPTPRRQPRRVVMSVLRIAATVLAIAALSYGVRQWTSDPMIEHRTPYGSQLTVVLPDSTVVELNANSRISYREGEPRKVWLDGEAFFQVRKKPATGANFQVVTDDLTVEVLGTAFNVVEKVGQTEVVLEEGSVKLNLERDFEPELFMEPGELVAFSAGSEAPVRKQRVTPETVSS
jgi:ferric-dicitrate binding protein FerR (iron transport regulator)